MSLVQHISKLSKINKKAIILNAFFRNHSIWNKDWKPGPYPRTEAERKAAAEKYGLDISEYQPYPDNGEGHGDYPKLPERGVELRDPYYPWDFPEHKRNLHDTLHVDEDMFGEHRVDANKQLRFSVKYCFWTFMLVMGGFYAAYELLEYMPMFRPVMPKQYPNQGKTHYTFELE